MSGDVVAERALAARAARAVRAREVARAEGRAASLARQEAPASGPASARWGGPLAGAAAAVLAIAACGGGGGGGGGGGAAGTLEILALGGVGTASSGGVGGVVEITSGTGSEVLLLASGGLDASFTAPLGPPLLGANPRVISADTTLQPAADGTIPGDVDPQSAATGLRVAEGATLSLAPSEDQDGVDPGFDTARLVLARGALIEGTVRLLPRAEAAAPGAVTSTASLALEVESLFVAATGRIDGSGADGVSVGTSTLAAGAAGEIEVQLRGAGVNRGEVLARGGDGPGDGGRGGRVEWNVVEDAVANLYNLGLVDASGGAGAAGVGGDGGGVSFEGAASGVFLAGALLARGGAGATGGGAGGSADVEIEGVAGGVTSSATIDVTGGDATIGDGGAGGGVEIEHASVARIAGSLLARGGAGGPAGRGGDGGSLQFEVEDREGFLSGAPPIAVFLAATIDVSGGAGGAGGDGGEVAIALPAATPPRPGEEPIVLLGYRRIDASGGDGATAGGGGGRLQIDNSGVEVFGRTVAGDTRNEVPFVARGGASSGGAGGVGGVFGSQRESMVGGVTVQSGALDLRGGDGQTGGGGGQAGLVSIGDIVNLAAIDASGGAGANGAGGAGGAAGLSLIGALRNEGALTVNGGPSATAEGGAGGSIFIAALGLTTLANLSCRGGDGVIGGPGGNPDLPASGGAAGGIEIFDGNGASAVAGQLDARGGRGAAAVDDGAPGRIDLDGVSLDTGSGVIGF